MNVDVLQSLGFENSYQYRTTPRMVSQEISGSLNCSCNLCHDGMRLVNSCSSSGLTSINGSFYFLPAYILLTTPPPFFFSIGKVGLCWNFDTCNKGRQEREREREHGFHLNSINKKN